MPTMMLRGSWPLFVLALPCVGSSQTGSAVCAQCHAEIYQGYQSTPMAHSARKLDPSAAPEQFEKTTFSHGPSGFQYRVS
jgi:hypothetical protein